MDLRQYDPAIGRWVVQDPVIHHDYSPYSAFDNNPVYWSDPSGADATAYTLNGKLVGASFTGQEAIDAFMQLVDGSSNDNLEVAVQNTYEFSTTPGDTGGEGGGNGNGNGGPKAIGGKYNGRDLSTIKSYNRETLFSFDVLFNTKMTHKETIELFKILEDRKDMFDKVMKYLGFTEALPALGIKSLYKDLSNANPSKITVALLLETLDEKLSRVSDGNTSVFSNYLKIHANDPKNMNGIYQIYEKNGNKIIPYGNLSVHYYDAYSGKYLGTVE